MQGKAFGTFNFDFDSTASKYVGSYDQIALAGTAGSKAEFHGTFAANAVGVANAFSQISRAQNAANASSGKLRQNTLMFQVVSVHKFDKAILHLLNWH